MSDDEIWDLVPSGSCLEACGTLWSKSTTSRRRCYTRLCAARYRQVIAKVSNMCEVVSKAAKVDRRSSKCRICVEGMSEICRRDFETESNITSGKWVVRTNIEGFEASKKVRRMFRRIEGSSKVDRSDIEGNSKLNCILEVNIKCENRGIRAQRLCSLINVL